VAEIEQDRVYTEDHEWVLLDPAEEDVVTLGITDFAQDALGDIVMVELPEVGDEVTLGEPFGSIESPKSVSDVFAPLTGEIVAINEELEDAPELVNDSPFHEGWLVRLRISDKEQLGALLSPGSYGEHCAAEDA